MDCANCGAPVNEGSETCDACGLPVAGSAAAAAAGATAASAGADPDATAVYPSGSGGGSASTGSPGVEKPFWKRTWFWVVVAVVVVAVAAIVAVVVTRGATVPAVVGLSSAEAKAEAEKAGMVYVVRGIQFTTAVTPGMVTVQLSDARAPRSRRTTN